MLGGAATDTVKVAITTLPLPPLPPMRRQLADLDGALEASGSSGLSDCERFAVE